MANEGQLKILRQGVEIWNQWRKENDTVQFELWKNILERASIDGVDLGRANLDGADLKGANLAKADLSGADFGKANLSRANLEEANLSRVNLRMANLEGANLNWANLSAADLAGANLGGASLVEANLSATLLVGANLVGAYLRRANFEEANLVGANLAEANLIGVNLIGADLERANLEGAKVGATVFVSLDLHDVRGLDKLRHEGPSSVGIDTLYRSTDQIPKVFLRGCGIPDALIEYLPSLISTMQPVQYSSCFISYSSTDEDFARHLYDRMRGDHLRVWFAPEELKGGEKLFDQIDQAIRVYDKLILVLSEASMTSAWVHTEVRRARNQEQRAGKRKLFPIRVVPMEQLQMWELFDTDTGTDVATEVRSYFIPDFSTWKDDDAFAVAYTRLLRDLKAAS